MTTVKTFAITTVNLILTLARKATCLVIMAMLFMASHEYIVHEITEVWQTAMMVSFDIVCYLGIRQIWNNFESKPEG